MSDDATNPVPEGGLEPESAAARKDVPDSADVRAARGAAFFDLDRTLIGGASTFAFGLAAWRNDVVSVAELASDALNAFVFRLTGGSDERSEATRDRILQAVAGNRQEELAHLSEDVVPALLEKLRPESKNLLDMHAEAGRDRYICSAAPIEIVQPLADSLGLEGAVGTESELVNGVYTGRLVGPFVYGAGKAEAVQSIVRKHGYDLRLCYAYSDSSSDLPLLELVGHPVAVNPDRSLEAAARQRGWPVVVFSRKTKRVVALTTATTGAVGLAVGTYLLGRRHGRIASENGDGLLAR